MALIVVGGHTRNIGKTSVVAGLIAAMPERRWTAIKITQFGHGVCSTDGEPCACETADHAVAITQERDSQSGTDSSRYLAAGAERSLWVRTRQGQLVEAMPYLRRELAAPGNYIVESNSLLRFVQPDFFVSVLDFEVLDFKGSALRYLDRADALLVRRGNLVAPVWKGVSPALLKNIPQFPVLDGEYCPAEFISFLKEALQPEWEKISLNEKNSYTKGSFCS